MRVFIMHNMGLQSWLPLVHGDHSSWSCVGLQLLLLLDQSNIYPFFTNLPTIYQFGFSFPLTLANMTYSMCRPHCQLFKAHCYRKVHGIFSLHRLQSCLKPAYLIHSLNQQLDIVILILTLPVHHQANITQVQKSHLWRFFFLNLSILSAIIGLFF